MFCEDIERLHFGMKTAHSMTRDRIRSDFKKTLQLGHGLGVLTAGVELSPKPVGLAIPES
jgi:hypothetical protein